jgi:hypothetical protein
MIYNNEPNIMYYGVVRGPCFTVIYQLDCSRLNLSFYSSIIGFA